MSIWSDPIWLAVNQGTTTVPDGSITRRKLHQTLAQEITKHGTDIEALDARVDEILGLPPGSTTGDALLNDIKIGWDGRTYDTPGNAVRGQVTELKGNIAEIADVAEHATVTDNIATTSFGVTVAKEDAYSISAFGTPTAGRRFICFNGNNAVMITSSSFVQTLPAGTYKFSIISNDPDPNRLSTAAQLRYTYTTFASEIKIYDGDVLTFTAPVMVGWVWFPDKNYGTAEDPTIITVHITTVTAKDGTARDDIATLQSAVAGTVKYNSAQELTEAERETARSNIDCVSEGDLFRYNFYDVLSRGNWTSPMTHKGITYTRNDDGSWTISGTATENSFCNIIRAERVIPRFIDIKRRYRMLMHGGTVPLRVYFYKTDGTSTLKNVTTDTDIVFPDDTLGVIVRFQISAGSTYNDTVNYELVPAGLSTNVVTNNTYNYANTITRTTETTQNTYNITANPSITTDTHGWLVAVDTNTADETGKTDMTPSIMAMLRSTGYCHLGEGIFYVSGNIDMPPSSTIEGCGDKTTIRLLQSVESGYVIRPTQHCTIRNIGISGGYSSPTYGASIGTRHGINWFANADGNEAEQIDALHSMIDGVFIRNFSGSGIRLHNTGYNYYHALYVSNCMIYRCYIGINIDYFSEFNKFNNIGMYWCKIAAQNNGGNNVFSNCTFHAFDTGFLIDNSDGLATNNSHGLLTNGTFCHIGSNAGKAIVVKNAANGYIFNACQIHYNSIEVENSDGIVFANFEFGIGTTGQGAVINVTGGNLVLFNGCMFFNDVSKPPVITITNNTKTKFVNCYGGVSGNQIGG